MTLSLRPAELRDRASTRQLAAEAFHPEDIGSFLDALRADGCILGEWLAEDQGSAIGHIVFSRVWVERLDGVREKAAILAPLAVRPNRQRQGVGLKLMKHALTALEARGERLFFVLGHPSYYPRAGFQPATDHNIQSPWQGKPSFMVRGTPVHAGRLALPKVIAEAG